jgi:hypothetical protein
VSGICLDIALSLRGDELILRITLFGIAALIVLGLLFWLFRRAKIAGSAEHLLRNSLSGDLLPKHYKYFPQVRRALSTEDNEYLLRRADPVARKSARRIRREVGLEFLHGLREDYTRLDRLARALTALAPAANPEREAERVWLAMRFEFRWFLVWGSLWSGMTPLLQLQSLTNFVGILTARLESALGTWQEATLSASSANLTA